jgi:hypothetical protein
MKKDSKSTTTKNAQPKAAKAENGAALAERDAKRGITLDVDKAVKMYKDGKTISEIAQAMGFPKGSGNNRTHAALVKAGARKPRPAEK